MEWFFGIFVLALALYLVPIILIIRSDRTQGGEKWFWVLITLFVSWFAWIAYLLLAPISDKIKKL